MEVFALVGAVWLAGYAVACCVWPYAACKGCSGAWKRRSPSGKAWRPCRRCGGSGRRIRAGRWVVQWFRFGSRAGR